MKKLLVLLLLTCLGCSKPSFQGSGTGYVLSIAKPTGKHPSPWIDNPTWYEVGNHLKKEDNWTEGNKVCAGPPDIKVGQKVYLGRNTEKWHSPGDEFILATAEE